jgi:SDR family mycofactocin-dependent oxidoreductase
MGLGSIKNLDGKVAFITGAGRGQGRSHAVRLAEEGADIIAVDVCRDLPTVPYAMASSAELEETAQLVRAAGRTVVTAEADVRDINALRIAFHAGFEVFGRLDIVIANAGVQHYGADTTAIDDDEAWDMAIAVMLTGVRNTIKITRDALIEGGRGGSIVITSSTAGMKGMSDGNGGPDGYVAAKHGVVGLMRTYANLLAQHRIRVNTVHPTGVETHMISNEPFLAWARENHRFSRQLQNLLPIPALQPVDISNAIAWLVSDEGRYVTGVTLPIDAGFTARI